MVFYIENEPIWMMKMSNLKSGKICIFGKGLVKWFWSKICIFFILCFLDQIGPEKVFHDVLDRK